MNFSSRFLAFVFIAAIALASCSGSLWEPPLPGAVIAKRFSPDKSYLAQIIAAETKGKYTLGVYDVRENDLLAERDISGPVGYHEHIVLLKWSDDSRIVTATIDHDFGENNRVFHLRITRPGA